MKHAGSNMAFLTRLWRKRLLSLEVPIPIRGGAFNYAATMLQMQYRVEDEFAERPRVVLTATSIDGLRQAHEELSAFVEALVDDLSEDEETTLAFLIESPEASVDSHSTERLSIGNLEDDDPFVRSGSWDSRNQSPISDYMYDL